MERPRPSGSDWRHGLSEYLGPRSGGRGYPDRNSASLLRTSPASSLLDAGPSDNVILPTLILLINYARLHTMPGRKNPTPTDEAAARHAKLAELERACEQLLEEEREAAAAAEARERKAAARRECEAAARREREAAARREREVVERRRREAAERREREIAETRDHSCQHDRRPCSEAGGSQARRWSASPGVSQSGGPAQSSRCVNLQFCIRERGGIGKH